VVTRDRHDFARAFIDDKHLTFTMLEDRDQKLFTAVHAKGLPATLFVAADGRLAYVYNGPALDDAKVRQLAEEHLGAAP
jgi:peroxiredoxin